MSNTNQATNSPSEERKKMNPLIGTAHLFPFHPPIHLLCLYIPESVVRFELRV